MNKILITILIITGFLIYKMISRAGDKKGIKGGKQQAVVKKKRLIKQNGSEDPGFVMQWVLLLRWPPILRDLKKRL